jgi:hypothetical protein
MKNKLGLLAVVMTAMVVSGCATVYPIGSLYTDIAVPAGVGTGEGAGSKVGKATANSYFALIATGDSSIEAAAKNGGITKIKFVDHKAKNILGFIGEYTTYVYGD